MLMSSLHVYFKLYCYILHQSKPVLLLTTPAIISWDLVTKAYFDGLTKLQTTSYYLVQVKKDHL